MLDGSGRLPSWSRRGLHLVYLRPDRANEDRSALVLYDFAEDRYTASLREPWCSSVSIPVAWSPDAKQFAVCADKPAQLMLVDAADECVVKQRLSLDKIGRVDSMAWLAGGSLVLAVDGRLLMCTSPETEWKLEPVPIQPEGRDNRLVCWTKAGPVFVSVSQP